jgi:hypothetical protein
MRVTFDLYIFQNITVFIYFGIGGICTTNEIINMHIKSVLKPDAKNRLGILMPR